MQKDSSSSSARHTNSTKTSEIQELFFPSPNVIQCKSDARSENPERDNKTEKSLLLCNSLISVPGCCNSVGNSSLYDDSELLREVWQFASSRIETGKRWFNLLNKKMGLGTTFEKWMNDYSEFFEGNNPKLIIKLAYNLCFVEYAEDGGSDWVEIKKKDGMLKVFDSGRIFALFEVVSKLVEQSDRKGFVEVVCQNSEVEILDMICKKETLDRGFTGSVEFKFPWNGEFTGFTTLVDLLEYVLKIACSPSIVLCIAKKVYGRFHNFHNGRGFFAKFQIRRFVKRSYQSDEIMKECLRTAINLGYKHVISVMLSGDIFECIRLMNNRKFYKKEVFREAFDMIIKTVADVITSLVDENRTAFKDEINNLLEKGIEIDIEAVQKKDMLDELEYREIPLSSYDKCCKKKLIIMFRKHVGDKSKIKLRKTVLGALISTFYFHHYDKLDEVKDRKPFELYRSDWEKTSKNEASSILNGNIDNTKLVQDSIIKFIQCLNSNSHLSSSWLFTDVLERIVNDNWEKLKAVCAAICNVPMQELIENVNVHTEVVDILRHFGVAV